MNQLQISGKTNSAATIAGVLAAMIGAGLSSPLAAISEGAGEFVGRDQARETYQLQTEALHQLRLTSPTIASALTPPVLVDDFEGEPGTPLVGWQFFGKPPTYSDVTAISGSGSGVSRFSGATYNASAEQKNLPNLTRAYLSYYFRIDHEAGAVSRNIKLARLSAGFANEYIQPIGITYMAHQDTGQFYVYSNAKTSQVPFRWLENAADGQWHRAEYAVTLSQPQGTPTGEVLLVLDGQVQQELRNVVTEENGHKIKWLTLPYYVAKDPGGDYAIYYDNLYLSTDQSRIELCDTPEYSACRTPVVLKPLAIDDTQVTLRLHPRDWQQPRYLFAFDSQGLRINQTAIALCPDCSIESQQ